MNPTILLVEDDPRLVETIQEALAPEGWIFLHAGAVAAGRELFQEKRPDLVVLDVSLPDGSGVELCRSIRSHRSRGTTPIIMLTAHGDIEDKATGFEAGADHYLVKPVQMRELRLWIAALLRRVRFEDKEGGVLRASDFIVDPEAHSVTARGQAIRNLTRKEFDLLYELVRRTPNPISKDYIMKTLWNTTLRDNTIEVYIRKIRAKLGEDGARIVTVPGVGYRFE